MTWHPPSKPVAASATMMTHLVLPSDVNLHGRAHGGMLLRLMDTAAYVCASRHAGPLRDSLGEPRGLPGAHPCG